MCQDKTDYEIFHVSFEIIPLSCNVYSSDLDPYDSIWLKLLTILVYLIEVIASIVMLAFVSYSVSRTGVRLGDPEAGTPTYRGRGRAGSTF